ncbi:hypothetical protein [Streptomyces sp. ITFR-6]|uniref:hypothetical protein n=1 Tax=Streptomyces sp. ITFR-6 TaxID=3075197 RepID=UPI00288983C2|nr:hypothetical protein [Streptomyces sp. ITFR-6]WNI34402.1 hypothetical protein RLT59_37930 [Streptomyces sp. ITFR-6]
MAATRTARKRPPARKKPAPVATGPAPQPTATSPDTVPVPAGPVAEVTVDMEALALVADARDRATDAADLIRDTARMEARVLVAGAETRAQGLLTAAGREAAVLRTAADGHARQVMREVAEEAGRRLAESTTRTSLLRTGAEQEAQQIRDQAHADAAQAKVAARAVAARHRAKAARAGRAIERRAQEQAARIRHDAEQVARGLLEQAAEEAAAIRVDALGVLDRARVEAGQQLDAARTEAEALHSRTVLELTVQREETEQEVAALRQKTVLEVTALREDAAREVAGARAAAAEDADRVRGEAATDAEQELRRVRAQAARLGEDAARELEAAREDADRTRKLAEEDASRQLATAAEDAERLTRTTREEAERVLADARTKRTSDLQEAEEALAQARLREADAEVTLKAADDLVAEAAARMTRATDRTERALERKRLKRQARQERRDAQDARKAKAREGQPTKAARARKFVKVNAERLLVIGPITAPMAVAWTGQAGFAEDILGWVVPFTILFAAAWELSTAFVGWMYHQARQGGDAGTLYRVSTWIFALGAAVMNFWHASGEPVPGSRVWDDKAQVWTEQITYWHFTPKAVAFAAMSIVGMVLWELYATLIHRRKLREDGRVAKARPSIGLVRWARYPVHSFTAWSLAITDANLTTLDRAWTAAGARLADRDAVRTARLADREAVRTGRALHRVVVPRVRTGDHGPAAIPTVLTITRADRSGPDRIPSPVRPVHYGPYPVRTGPDQGDAVHGPVRTAGAVDRTAGPALALESGPAGHTGADQRTPSGPDRTGRSVPAAHGAPAAARVTVRTADPASGPQEPDRSGPVPRPGEDTGSGPDRDVQGGPDLTVITLTDLERTALDRLRTANQPLNRTTIAHAVRTEGGSISTDRAGQISVALKQHPVH